MCGIVGYAGNKDCTSVLIDGLKKLEYRGYDSAGIAVFENDDIKILKTKGRLNDLENKIKESDSIVGNCGIGHTRWATHGEPSDINSHPHGTKIISIVHNGIIENYLHLKERLINKGYNFESETDTEIIAKLLHYYYEGDPIEAIRHMMSVANGSYALGMIFKDYPDTIYSVRKDSPLIVGKGDGENFIASDIPAILKYTKDYYLIEDNEIAVLTKDNIDIYDIDGERVEKELLTAIWNVEEAEKGGYPHFMLKEIFEQPEAVKKTLSSRIVNQLPELGIEGLSDERLKSINKVHMVACGTAMHAGMIGKAVFEELTKIPVNVEIASEFRYNNPIINKDDMVILISQSGETADTLAALRLAKSQGIYTLAIVNVVGSSIAREADSVLYTWAGPEISVASTKAYSVQLAALYLLAIKVALVKDKIDISYASSLCAELLKIPDLLEDMLNHAENVKYYASKFQNARDLFFIGRGIDYSLSMEGSIKLKEISYIHSEAYAAGELKHGTISLITSDVPVVAIATQSRLFEKMIGNIKEVSTRGAKVLMICGENAPMPEKIAKYVVKIPEISEIFKPLLAVIPLQLFAYHTAVLRGCDVDKPRNLAKSVTVE